MDVKRIITSKGFMFGAVSVVIYLFMIILIQDMLANLTALLTLDVIFALIIAGLIGWFIAKKGIDYKRAFFITGLAVLTNNFLALLQAGATPSITLVFDAVIAGVVGVIVAKLFFKVNK